MSDGRPWLLSKANWEKLPGDLHFFNATKAFGIHSVTLGVEPLDAGFQTPVATLHAFNGVADAFVSGRANGTHGGLTDLYLSHTLPVGWGMKTKDQELSQPRPFLFDDGPDDGPAAASAGI
ncbi:MAG: hypothetical protein NTW21_41090 [Verrucomicrobia bacterium]|nr:hypothetical protein [Verrucomicrobiota bacterium]